MAQKPLIIGIAGGTASGKTTVARRIVEGLSAVTQEGADLDTAHDFGGFIRDEPPARRIAGPVALLDLDSYYRELNDLPIEEKRAFNWDHPDAFDTDLLIAQLHLLKAGRAIEKPVYSFAHYARESGSVPVRPGAAIVVEGILVLAMEALRREFDVKIFVDADDDVRVIRRLTRDMKERGRDFDSVVDQYFRTVRPMHNGFVEPSKRHADIIIPHGGNNETAVQMVIYALRARLLDHRG
jgi:uridine kinase